MRFALETQLLRLVPAFALGAVALSSSPSAHAHFTLTNPPPWVQEDAQGNPQKAGPCGGAVGAAGVTPTNTVTTYTAGETIMVTWKETIGHPGHFRISLTEGESRDSLVAPPVVTTNGDGVSGNSISATTVPDGTGVVLLDNLFNRPNVAGAQVEPFTQAVTLPNRTCEKCTLQVTQFMSQHAPGYFYYHCADIKIVASGAAPSGTGGAAAGGAGGSAAAGTGGSAAGGAAGSATTGASGSTSSAGSSSNPDLGDDSSVEDDDGGCTISSGAPSPLRSSPAALALFGLAVSFWRRRAAR